MNLYKQIQECESCQRIWGTDLSDWILFWPENLRFKVLEPIFSASTIRNPFNPLHNPLAAMSAAFQMPILVVKVHKARFQNLATIGVKVSSGLHAYKTNDHTTNDYQTT